MYRLIVTDLDGTLLRDDLTISSYTKSVIQKSIKSGVQFMIATGRIFGGARQYAKELSLTTPILSCNGALIKEQSGSLIYGNHIQNQSLQQIFDILTAKGLYFHSYGEESFFTEKFTETVNSFYSFNKELPDEERFPMVEIKPQDLIGKEPIYKVLTRFYNQNDRDQVYQLLSEIPGISVTSSWHNSFDICATGVNKATAIEQYAKQHGLNPSEIIAFGDNHNDLEMIEYAGFGVATGNAVDALKKSASYITENNNQDGVAKAIEKFVLLP